VGTASYLFRNFRLNPVARELFRDGQPVSVPASAFDCLVYLVENRHRTIARDELIGAIWGRADVSENLLAQTIVRLRRTFDDTGSEQHTIRTITRVGYRWMADTRPEPDSSSDADTPVLEAARPIVDNGAQEGRALEGASDGALPIAPLAPQRAGRRVVLVVGTLLAVMVILGSLFWVRPGQRVQNISRPAATVTTVVLPAEVKATDEWQWLRLGLMDRVSTRLAHGGLPVMPSASVMAMLKESRDKPDLAFIGFPRLQPEVTSNGGNWSVRLALLVRGQPPRYFEAQSTNVLAATQAATDKLLVAIGRRPTDEPVSDVREDAQGELLQRVSAARLAGQLPLAWSLIEEAPEALRGAPAVAYASAVLQCDFGERAACKQHLEEVLGHVPASTQPALRGDVLHTLALVYLDLGQTAKAQSSLDQAITLLKRQHQPEILAPTYLTQSWLDQAAWRLDAAATHIGLARSAYVMSGDALGVARADFYMGGLDERRGHLESALASLQHAKAGFERLGMHSMLPVTLDAMAEVEKMLLNYPDELATTQGFWPPEAYVEDIHMRLELVLVRAIALADNGRLVEASALIERILQQGNPSQDAALRSEAREMLAQWAMWQGDYAAAETHAGEALTPALEEGDRREYALTWLLKIRAMRHQGKTQAVGVELSDMQAWLARVHAVDPWCATYGYLAQAEQEVAQGKRESSLRTYRTAMTTAENVGVPELLVEVGQSYVPVLIQLGMLDQAKAVGGNLQPWANRDMRVPLLQAQLYAALGKPDMANKALEHARQLAGERKVPAYRDILWTPIQGAHDDVPVSRH